MLRAAQLLTGQRPPEAAPPSADAGPLPRLEVLLKRPREEPEGPGARWGSESRPQGASGRWPWVCPTNMAGRSLGGVTRSKAQCFLLLWLPGASLRAVANAHTSSEPGGWPSSEAARPGLAGGTDASVGSGTGGRHGTAASQRPSCRLLV